MRVRRLQAPHSYRFLPARFYFFFLWNFFTCAGQLWNFFAVRDA
jgi:hypothetical protein